MSASDGILEVMVTCCHEPPVVDAPAPAPGWGDDGTHTSIHGAVREIRVARGGAVQFGLRILEDGSVIMTDYANMAFRLDAPRSLLLEPGNPWQK